MPARSKSFLAQFEARRTASRQHWQTELTRYEFQLLAPDAFPDWFLPDAAEFGLIWDPLAARIDPARYIAALRYSLNGRCDLYEGWAFTGWNATAGRATPATGGVDIIAGKVVLAAGYQTFELARRLTGLELGGGVKGQAVLLESTLPPERPVIYDDGMYIVAHSTTHCAVGSTTESEWSDPRAVDDALADKLAHARRLCPPLRDAAIVASWAGVRPKSAARDPIVGRLLPDAPLYIASGGFKITVGIAHAIAERLIDAIVHDRDTTGLPATFCPSIHLAAARARQEETSKIA